jgi:2,3-bisphosphoglycerate-independent phosphoglycerate mutase
MKFIILLGDGMADYPIQELGGKTPLEVAETPNMDSLARKGFGGSLRTIPAGMAAGSDVANLSILGYDPIKYYTGRGPLEAASIGVSLEKDEMAFRCNLITELDGAIVDYSGGHISTPEAEDLIATLNENSDLGTFHKGLSYRHLFVSKNIQGISSTPPHDVIGGLISDHLIKSENGSPKVEELNRMILNSKDLLEDHPINLRRKQEGKRPANMIWLWGEGIAPSIEPFHKKYGIRAAIISAVDLLKGIGIYAGLEIIEVPGASGLIDTNWEGKAEAALKTLKEVDLVYVHVEAIDEAAHSGDLDLKIKAIEAFDKRLIGSLIDKIDFECRIALLPDHFTPLRLKTHTHDPVPFIISGSDVTSGGLESYSEKEVRENGSIKNMNGHEFINFFLKRFQ